jgi:hypothetical protein
MPEETVVRELDSTEPKVNAEENAKATPAGDPQATAEQGENETEEKRKSGWIRAKEAKLRAERERDYWREKALGTPKPEPEVKVEAKPKPVWKDYEEKGTQEQYFEDLADWKAEEKLKAFKETLKADEKKRETQTEQEKQAERWKQSADEFRKEHSDFDEVIAQGNPSEILSSLVARNKDAVRLAYHLANNPELESQLSRMTDPVDVAQELGLIRAQLAQEKPKAEVPEPDEKPEPAVIKAPKPPTPVSKPSPSAKPFDPNDEAVAKSMTADEWVRKRNRQLRGQQ